MHGDWRPTPSLLDAIERDHESKEEVISIFLRPFDRGVVQLFRQRQGIEQAQVILFRGCIHRNAFATDPGFAGDDDRYT
ncbi:hypothetical protein ACC679_38450, partial [Rhizobium ruizarguesonis]